MMCTVYISKLYANFFVYFIQETIFVIKPITQVCFAEILSLYFDL